MPRSLPKPKGWTFPISTTGPYRILNQKVDYITGPGEPPPLFVTATTSTTEWIWYWASAKIYNDPRDPMQPPFFGGADWGYQIPSEGGRRNPLGAVVDFIYYNPGETVGIRIQTDRFHESAGPLQQAYDRNQKMQLSKWLTVRDVFEQDFIQDRTGEAACRLLVETLGGRKRIQPSRSGTYRRVQAGSI